MLAKGRTLSLSRGLAALTLIATFFSSLHAEFLYKDEVVNNPNFANQIESIGRELKAKTGVSLYVVMVRDLEQNESISDFEKRLTAELNDSAVILTFIELEKQVDILARPTSLYKDFNKAQILSPNATFVGSVVSALMFARTYDEAKELIVNRGGTILPILGERAKGDDITKKYSVAIFNGYADIAEQIAASRGQTLTTSAGSGSQEFIDWLRLVFYSVVLYAVVMYIRRIIVRRKASQNG